MKTKFYSILVLICIFLAASFLGLIDGGERKAPSNDAELFGPYAIERVVDGDTLIINIDGENTRVRMIGIDTAESVPDNPDRITDEGIKAANYTKSLLTGAEVLLEYDEEKTDKYGRVLAYIYIPDKNGLTFVNELLVREGFADLMTIEPNTKYREILEKSYAEK